MANQSIRHWLSAEQFGRTRPVRAPKVGQWPSTRPSASKNGQVTDEEGEKDRASAGLSTAYGRSMALRKVLWNRNPFRYLACGRELLWKRSASCSAIHQLWCAHGARTAKLLRARPVARQFTSFDARTAKLLRAWPRAKRLLCHPWQSRGWKTSGRLGEAALPSEVALLGATRRRHNHSAQRREI